MRLAVNYSKETQELVMDQAVQIDMFKCPDFSKDIIKQAKKSKPCYVHFDLNIGSGELKGIDWDHIKKLRENTNTPYVNVHAVAFSKDYPNVDVLTKDSSQIKKIVDVAIQDIEIVANEVGAENIIIENVVCRGKDGNMMRAIIDPDVLSKIINETGCGLLLDTAHAQMTSKCLGFDVKEYISQLPLESLKELHITGIQPGETGSLRDSMPMTDDDWELASWVLERIKKGIWPEPWVVAFEYGGVGPIFDWRSDKNVLKKQIPKLYNLVK